MDEVRSRKLEALQLKQYIDRLVTLYKEFQTYVEGLARALYEQDEVTRQDLEALVRQQEQLRLHLDDNENLFLEWNEGDQILNPHIFSLVREPDLYRHDRNGFRGAVLLATEKFEYLIRKQETSLRELHDQLALLTSEEVATATTSLETKSRLSSTADSMAKADQIIDKGIKWGGHVIQFGLWARDLFQTHGLWK